MGFTTRSTTVAKIVEVLLKAGWENIEICEPEDDGRIIKLHSISIRAENGSEHPLNKCQFYGHVIARQGTRSKIASARFMGLGYEDRECKNLFDIECAASSRRNYSKHPA